MSSLACCSGALLEGEGKGTIEMLGGAHNCYIAKAPEGGPVNNDYAIIFLTDIFGFTISNSRLLCDDFAKSVNCLVVMPDLFKGTEPPTELFDQMEPLMDPKPHHGCCAKLSAICAILGVLPGFLRRNSKEMSVAIAIETIEFLRKERGTKRFGVVGYCWGAQIAMLLAEKENICDSFASCHPGPIKVPSQVANICKPSCYIFPEDECSDVSKKPCFGSAPPSPKAEFLAFLSTKSYKSVLKTYDNVKHGFACRGDISKQHILAAKLDAFETCSNFFIQTLSNKAE